MGENGVVDEPKGQIVLTLMKSGQLGTQCMGEIGPWMVLHCLEMAVEAFKKQMVANEIAPKVQVPSPIIDPRKLRG